jgi:Tol biopolymer transport system component
MRLRRSLGATCAVVAILVGGCGGEDEARSDLAFVSTRDGDYAIYVMGADGDGQRRLTEHDASATSPARLFFQIEPAWSPDATRIAFTSRRAGDFDVYVMDADGTGTRRLTATKENDGHPTWSPDGDEIAFARDSDIWVMNADGSNARRVSDPMAEESQPSWAPDGSWLAYIRREPGTASREIWLMHPDGSQRHVLLPQTGSSTGPTWSPDSARIAFSSNEEGGRLFEIYTVGVDGKGLRTVVPTSADNFEPSWSPDGSTIAYQEGGAIFTVELEDGDIDKLTDQANNDSSPAWNPKPAAGDE